MSINRLENYDWLNKANNELTLPLSSQKMHHAFLIEYVKGCGKSMLTSQLAMRLLCLTPNYNLPCQTCHHCSLFLANNHPDFYHIKVGDNKQMISAEQIRSVINKMHEKSQQGGSKVILIDKASKMSEAASNALLKTLEEPADNTYFILTDEQSASQMATIKSRCYRYILKAPSSSKAALWLKNQLPHHESDAIITAVMLSNNAPLAALKLLDSENWNHRLQICNDLKKHIEKHDFWDLREALNQQKDDYAYLNYFCSLIVDAMTHLCSHERFIINKDQKVLINALAKLGEQSLYQLYALWTDILKKITTVSGVNKDLLYSHLLAESEMIFIKNKHS